MKFHHSKKTKVQELRKTDANSENRTRENRIRENKQLYKEKIYKNIGQKVGCDNLEQLISTEMYEIYNENFLQNIKAKIQGWFLKFLAFIKKNKK